MKGLVIQLLNRLSKEDDPEEMLKEVGERMNLSQMTILSEKSLYKRKRPRVKFSENLGAEAEEEELSGQDILNLNKLKARYSKGEIEEFIGTRMMNGRMEVTENTVTNDEEFDKLILAYDYSTRRKSLYQVENQDARLIDNGTYRYPALVFVRRNT